ncbi:poly-gamma-glutamate synthesis protein (capsule biosynthesis protein) [Enhydrobacter aerosaccus]|uniref:Poly-gamma-glutamate synthesis protein (Capsule biosynthesis protein) n=1 Tax=Enhydrobacter aerosaccus TaxID=225324 RepID=A0A1T4LMZ8_9HYPH|nr:CapA family protein [Enhydrobacter aerosaccus]SJZ56120.1 poly-gamma-glutamate synthesis protein (capsule biosynthesis protein) [Enhydrobacter aerosaccus]
MRPERYPVLAAAGDIVIRSRLFDERGAVHPEYERTLHYLRNADLVWGSCEVQFAAKGYRTDAPIAYLVDPMVAADLGRAGFGIMTVATNHTCDFGPEAFLETLDNLQSASITPVGGGRTVSEAVAPRVLDVAGRRIGFLAVSCLLPPDYAATEQRPGIAPLQVEQWTEFNPILLATEPGAPLKMRSRVRAEDQERLITAIQALRPRVDLLIVSVHWGYGRGDPQAEYQRPLGHAIINAGADMVLGNHPHSPAGIETYRGRPILYSLGNHIAQQDRVNATPIQKEIFSQIDPWSLVCRIEFCAAGVRTIEFCATECDVQGMPILIESEADARPILDRFRRLSATMGTEIMVEGPRAIARFTETEAMGARS